MNGWRALAPALALTIPGLVSPPPAVADVGAARLTVDEPPLAQCGMDAYRLLPESQMGQLLEFEELPLYRMQPGTIDALIEGTDLGSLVPVPWGVRTFRYRYTTQDRGQLVEATAILTIPTHPAAGRRVAEAGRVPRFPWALFLHGTTGFSDPCAPSALLEGPAEVALFASQGFITVAPDYIGMNGFGDPSTTTHGYLIGEQTAIGSWDALRAGQELLKEAVVRPFFLEDRRVVIWGASQGGHAALFTELYGPWYAPEFDVAGVVASVPPSDLRPLVSYGFDHLSGVTTLMASEMVANQAWYGSPADFSGVFTNEAPFFLADNAYDTIFVEEECNPGDGLEGDSVDDLFLSSFIDSVLAGDPEAISPWSCFWEVNSLSASPVPPLRFTPTLMQYSEEDELVIVDTQKPDFDRLCDMGYQLQYLECAGARHTDGALWSISEHVSFLKDRLAGVPMTSVCQRSAPVCCPGSPADVCTAP